MQGRTLSSASIIMDAVYKMYLPAFTIDQRLVVL